MKRVEREKQEAEAKKKVQTIAAAVMDALDGKWANSAVANDYRVRIRRESDGLELLFTDMDRNRLRIHHFLPSFPPGAPYYGKYYDFPQWSDEAKPARNATETITVSMEKAPCHIARDVARRLMPGAEIRQAFALADIQKEMAYDQTLEDTAKAVAEAIGSRNGYRRDESGGFPQHRRYGEYWLAAEVKSPNHIEITVNLEEIQDALDVLKAIRSAVGERYGLDRRR